MCWRRCKSLSVRKPRQSALSGMAGHCERGVRGLLPSLLGWQHRQFCFASIQEDYQSYGVDDESLLMSKRITKRLAYQMVLEFRNDWRLE